MISKRFAFLREQGAENTLSGILRGIEKENLRVTQAGHIAQTHHPAAFGSALTHPNITTDFSESLLELVTDPIHGLSPLFSELSQLHVYAAQALKKEYLWPLSIPPDIPDPQDIHLAEYGQSHEAQMRHLYRVGLSWRYGPRMQTIAGIHYNLSFPEALLSHLAAYDGHHTVTPEYRSQCYLSLIRQYLRNYWLLAYLFGASPACLANALPKKLSRDYYHLITRDGRTYMSRYATCLRMSEFGYQNNVQSRIPICFNTLHDYTEQLLKATQTPHPAFTKIGVKVAGTYRQLNDSLLQIENEYYSPIRPKAVGEPYERPALALRRLGVQYLEVRILDLDPFVMENIRPETMAFLDLFLTYCLVTPEKPLSFEQTCEARTNFTKVATAGRQPLLKLQKDGQDASFITLAEDLLDALHPVATWMDKGLGGTLYQTTLAAQIQKLRDPDTTPSGQVYEALLGQQRDHQALGLALAEKHAQTARAASLKEATLSHYQKLAKESIAAQKTLESSPKQQQSFEAYLAQYFAQGQVS